MVHSGRFRAVKVAPDLTLSPPPAAIGAIVSTTGQHSSTWSMQAVDQLDLSFCWHVHARRQKKTIALMALVSNKAI